MNEVRNARVAKAALNSVERMKKRLHSLHRGFAGSDVMRGRRGGLVRRALSGERVDVFDGAEKSAPRSIFRLGSRPWPESSGAMKRSGGVLLPVLKSA